MPTPTSRLSYTRCFELFEAAMNDPVGVRVTFKSKGDANHFRLRLHAARALDRRENAEMYEPGHVLFGRSAYDDIIIKIRDGEDGDTYLFMEKLTSGEMEVVGMSELVEPVKPEPPEVAVARIDRRV